MIFVLIILAIQYLGDSKTDPSMDIQWKNYTFPDLQIFYRKLHPAGRVYLT
jgi:hypothetical protein